MDKQFYFPWVRKGLGAFIDEKESLEADGTILCRPELTVKSTYTARHNQPKEGEEEETSGVVLEKTVKFVGPGDILKINPSAVMKIHPEGGSEGFPVDYLPYIEFWEPDFLWRYTPASADEAKLRPWLMLVTVKKEDLRVFTPAEGLPYVSVDDKAWDKVFPTIADHVCSAHAQGRAENRPDFCRLLGMRKDASLDKDAEYVALLIPAYETGRLRGLGLEEEDIQDIPAQQASWAASFAKQKDRKRGTEFPIYYQWSFTTGKESFDAIAARLAPVGVEKSGIKLDVTDMGEGFSYNTVAHESSRTSIIMPAATKTIDFQEEPAFPAKASRKFATEKILYANLENLLQKSPVFIENLADIAGVAISEQDSEDPWVVPPVYGARHVMSTKLNDKNAPWVQELNMDVHHRAAAGLGRKIVQQHQEELMDRAWKQVEAVQALNNELYERLLSLQANRALRGKTVDQFTDSEDNSKYVEYMMRYLSSMRNAGSSKYSLSSILKKAGIPESFASPSFHNNAERLARAVGGMDTTTLMDQIVKDQIFRFKQQEPVGAFDPKKIIRWCENGKTALTREMYEKYWKEFLSIKYKAKENEDHSWSYTVDKVTPKNLTYTIDSKTVVGDNGTTLSVCPPIKFVENQILDACKKIQGDVESFRFKTLQDAILSFSPDAYHTYPRLYAMKEEHFLEVISPGYRGKLSESGQGLFYAANGTGYLHPNMGLALSPDIYQGTIGFQSRFVKWKDASIGFYNLKYLPKGQTPYMTVYPLPGGFYGERSSTSKFNCENCQGADKASPDTIKYRVADSCEDRGTMDLLLSHLVNACRGAVPIKEYNAFKESVISLFSGLYFTSWSGGKLVIDNNKRNAFLTSLRSVLDGNVGMNDLAKISDADDINRFSGGILSLLPKHKSIFSVVANKAFNGHMATASLCFLDEIGPWMLALLAHGLADTQFSKKMQGTIERIDEFIKSNPAFTVISLEDYKKWLETSVTRNPDDTLSYSVGKYLLPERKYLNGLIEKANKLISYQSEPVEEAVIKPVDDKAVTNLQKEVENEDAYARMRDIAVMYYKQFFADDEEGARLRGEYLDELLRSKYPILAYPIFPEPTYYYLDMFSDKFIIPGLDEIPMDGIAMFKNNPAFTEAYLCGMNTEMGAELQWREYPTDRRGSYFRKFWDSESTVEAVRSDSFFDIKPVHLWEKTKLGENHLDGKGNLLIFAIHSELFKLYPGTRVYLHKSNSKMGFGQGRIDPVMETFVREDIFLVGFKGIDVPDVIGNPQTEDYGYLLAFEQDLDDLNFFQTTEKVSIGDSAATRADHLQDRVTIYGKHVSRFVTV